MQVVKLLYRYSRYYLPSPRYYRLRIPVFGRALAYHENTADLYFCGSGSQMYRLNLEQGRFLNSMDTAANSLNCLSINPQHSLVCAGTSDGRVSHLTDVTLVCGDDVGSCGDPPLPR